MENGFAPFKPRYVPRPNPCAWCGSDRNEETRREGEPLCSCPHTLGVFVFGSNIAGIHGAGAALAAVQEYDAEYGVGYGPTGRSYAIPTKDEMIETMPIGMILPFIEEFKEYARQNWHQNFLVTRIGCGLAGYTDEEIAPLFFGITANCIAPIEWRAKWPEQFKDNAP